MPCEIVSAPMQFGIVLSLKELSDRPVPVLVRADLCLNAHCLCAPLQI